jgi:peptidoglycan biosynthesis protein MviN/MurJ (putative lipid II flippase)
MILNVMLSIALMGEPSHADAWWGAAFLDAASHALAIADLRHAGISLATGLSATANGLLLLAVLRSRLPEMRLAPLAGSIAVHLAAASAMAVVVLAWLHVVGTAPFSGAALLRVGGGVTLGCAAYLAAAAALGSAEIVELLEAAGVRRVATKP